MNDLETRLRESLGGDVPRPDAERFLRDVHRRSTWRQGRHAAAGVALVVTCLVATSVVLRTGRDDRPVPAPLTQLPSSSAPTSGTTRGRVLDLAAGGNQVIEVSAHDGCRRCSVIRERTESGWQPIGTISGGSPAYGAVQRLYLAPNGLDGWADGRLLWVTHDGGQTWRWEDRGPGLHPGATRYLAVGPHAAYAVVTSPGGPATLWRTEVGSDRWQRVNGVPRLPDFTSFAGVTDDDRMGLLVSGEGGSGNALVITGPDGPSTIPMPFGADVLLRAGGTTFWASVPGPHSSRMFRLVDGRWQSLGTFPAQGWWPLDTDRVLLDRSPAAVLSEQGVEPTDLRAGAFLFAVERSADGRIWVLGTRGRVFTSTDALHWESAD